jgi:Electron transfer DM13
MQKPKSIIGSIVGIVVAIAWYLLRPELVFFTKMVNEALPGIVTIAGTARDPQTSGVATGRFHSVAHDTSGLATIHHLSDGKRFVRFTTFETSNGPDVRIYLVAVTNATDNETVTRAGFVDLDAMKGNRGDQHYSIPSNIDLGRFQSATIWCRRFEVNFATAPLTPQKQIWTGAESQGSPRL